MAVVIHILDWNSPDYYFFVGTTILSCYYWESHFWVATTILGHHIRDSHFFLQQSFCVTITNFGSRSCDSFLAQQSLCIITVILGRDSRDSHFGSPFPTYFGVATKIFDCNSHKSILGCYTIRIVIASSLLHYKDNLFLNKPKEVVL